MLLEAVFIRIDYYHLNVAEVERMHVKFSLKQAQYARAFTAIFVTCKTLGISTSGLKLLKKMLTAVYNLLKTAIFYQE